MSAEISKLPNVTAEVSAEDPSVIEIGREGPAKGGKTKAGSLWKLPVFAIIRGHTSGLE